MAGGKMSARQKMINLMYIVLMALLALNVSKDILDAFVILDKGINETLVTFEEKNQYLYDKFYKANIDNPVKVEPWLKKANELKSISNDLVAYIENLKRHLYKTVEGISQEMADTLFLSQVEKKDDYDVPTHILIGSDPGNPRRGEYSALELKEKILNYRSKILSFFDEKIRIILEKDLGLTVDKMASSADGRKEPWEVNLFFHTPLAATVTMLSKVQMDIRNAESEALKYLFANIDEGSVSFNTVEGAVLSPSTFVLQGNKFTADIFLAAYDNKQGPEIFVGDYDAEALKKNQLKMLGPVVKPIVKDGKGLYEVITTGVGEKTLKGVIKIKTTQGDKYYPFASKYTVGIPSVTIAATQMNVFYAGIPNPVAIAAAGVLQEQMQVTINHGRIRKNSSGIYEVTDISPGQEVVISITANGKLLGTSKFRAKKIPNPVPMIGSVTQVGVLSKALLMAIPKIITKMDGFEFPVSTEVLSYKVEFNDSGEWKNQDVKGASLEPIKPLIEKLKRNTMLSFQSIVVRMPDGANRVLGPINIKIN